VVLIDTNRSNIESARELGLEAINASIYNDDLTDNIELNDMGYLVAMTGNDEINKQAISKYGETLGENGCYRLMNSEERLMSLEERSQNKDLLSVTHDYLELMQLTNEYPSIQELQVETQKNFNRLIDRIGEEDKVAALFLKNQNHIQVLSNPDQLEVDEKSQLVYIGKPIDVENIFRLPDNAGNNGS
jgi:hypothetical protein